MPPSDATRLELGDEDGRCRPVKISVAGLPPVESHLDLGNGGTLSLARILLVGATGRWPPCATRNRRPAASAG